MRELLVFVIGMIFLFSVSILSAEAKILTYYPTDDTFVVADEPDKNFDGNGLELSDSYPNRPRFKRIYLKFDLSDLSGMTITSATLYLYLDKFYSHYDEDFVNLHRVTEHDWNERTLTWNNQPDNNLVYITTTKVYLYTWGGGEWKTWRGLESLVQGWVEGEYPNYGIMLECDSDSVYNEIAYFTFNDNESEINRPYLKIEAVPLPSTLFLFGSGLIGLAVIRQKKFRKI